MNNKSTGIGIIGFDHWYWAYSAAYSVMVNPKTRFVGIWDENEEEAKKLAARYKAENCYTDYHRLLENPEVDAVMIFTTTSQHSKIAIEAINQGKHVLVNKPIARTLKEADKMIEEASKANIKLMAIGAAQFMNDFPKHLLEENIGSPITIYYSLRAPVPRCKPHLSDPGWFVDPQKAAGGAFIDHACYMVGALRRYLNSEVESVYGQMDKLIHKGWDVEDFGVATLRFKNRVIAIVESTFTGQLGSPIRLVVTGTEGEAEILTMFGEERRITIWNSKGSYKKQSFSIALPSYVQNRVYLEPSIAPPPGLSFFKPTIDEFIQCVFEDRDFTQTAEDARTNLEICLAAYESMRVGNSLKLPLGEEVDVPSILARL